MILSAGEFTDHNRQPFSHAVMSGNPKVIFNALKTQVHTTYPEGLAPVKGIYTSKRLQL